MAMNETSISATVDELNSLLRGELSAVETYDQVIERFPEGPMSDLVENRTCHSKRIPILTQRIIQLGGTPSASSGAWGVVANLTEAGAKMLGKKSAINALEMGEDTGLKDYRDSLEDLDPQSANIVRRDLLPAQERTHRRMSMLQKA